MMPLAHHADNLFLTEIDVLRPVPYDVLFFKSESWIKQEKLRRKPI